jgi:hypothetical protein
MVIQTENRPREDAAGIVSFATLNTANIKRKIAVPQAENDSAAEQFDEQFPSLFELVTQNAEAPMQRAAAYLRICDEFRNLGDLEAWCDAGDKFLEAGREIAKSLALLKTPKVFSNELADQLEEKALGLHNLADLTEMQANRVRSAVSL